MNPPINKAINEIIVTISFIEPSWSSVNLKMKAKMTLEMVINTKILNTPKIRLVPSFLAPISHLSLQKIPFFY